MVVWLQYVMTITHGILFYNTIKNGNQNSCDWIVWLVQFIENDHNK